MQFLDIRACYTLIIACNCAITLVILIIDIILIVIPIISAIRLVRCILSIIPSTYSNIYHWYIPYLLRILATSYNPLLSALPDILLLRTSQNKGRTPKVNAKSQRQSQRPKVQTPGLSAITPTSTIYHVRCQPAPPNHNTYQRALQSPLARAQAAIPKPASPRASRFPWLFPNRPIAAFFSTYAPVLLENAVDQALLSSCFRRDRQVARLGITFVLSMLGWSLD